MVPSPLRRAALVGACLLGLAPAAAEAQSVAGRCATATSASASPAKGSTKRKPTPKVSRVRPTKLAIGATLEVRGTNFLPGRCKNTVVFQRKGGKAVFVKAEIGTKKLLKVTLPDRLEAQLLLRRGLSVPTRFRLRVVATRFGTRFTSTTRSPLIGPKPPPAPPEPAPVEPVPDVDSDGDGLLNSVDPDDDNDLLSDAEEGSINRQLPAGLSLYLDTLSKDSDGDGVEDGYELRSARDLNDSAFLPYPAKRPYPNPLFFGDTTTDFDGDGLTLYSEQRLWLYEPTRVGPPRSLDPLSYSDGTKYSIYNRDSDGRRTPALEAAGYVREQNFRDWAAASGRDRVLLYEPDGAGNRNTVAGSLFDVNRDGEVSSGHRDGYPHSESSYYDTDESRYLDDGERDEDADGLTNVDESARRLSPGFWDGLYEGETPYLIKYFGTEFDDPDTDGDTVRDGADDLDYDDIPNIMELSRAMAYDARRGPRLERVNPFNPCLPDVGSRTCPRY